MGVGALYMGVDVLYMGVNALYMGVDVLYMGVDVLYMGVGVLYMGVDVLYLPLTRTACRTWDTPASLFYPASPGDSSCAAATQLIQKQINNAKHINPLFMLSLLLLNWSFLSRVRDFQAVFLLPATVVAGR